MAQIRRSIVWMASPFAVLMSLLFSMMNLAPPAWAKTAGNTESRPNTLTALIEELCEDGLFDRCLQQELQRLAQTAPKPEPELVPPDELMPAPDVLLRQQPGAQAQPQQVVLTDPQMGTTARPGADQPRQAAPTTPQLGTSARPGALQPQQSVDLGECRYHPDVKLNPDLSIGQPGSKLQPK